MLLFAASIVISLFVLEFGLRVALGAPPAWRYPQESYVTDAEVGYALRPLQDGFTIAAPFHINSKGIRDTEYASFPARDVVRILALGDSQTFGVGVRSDETWPKQLERALEAAQPTHRFEVLNAGLPASATLNQARLLPRLLEAYHPACVVLGFYVNDVVALKAAAPFQIAEGSELTKRIVYIAKRSALVSSVLHVLLPIWNGPDAQAEALHEQGVLEDDGSPSVEAGWAQVDGSLASIARAALTRGACLAVLAMPRVDQIDGRESTTRYQERLRMLTERLVVPMVDPLESLRQERAQPLLVAWDGHYSGTAQGIMARELTSHVLAALNRP